MGIFERLFGNKSGDNENRSRKQEKEYSEFENKKKNAGTLSILLSNADTDSVFGGFQTNGYVQNNEVYIEKKLKKIYPSFNSKELADRAKELFLAISEASSLSELDPGLAPYVVTDFYFGVINKPDILRFNVGYLNLYKKQGDIEYIYACVCFLERINAEETELARYFIKFKRPTRYKTLEGRNIRFTACPKCGSMVYFQNKDGEQCIRCDEAVSFKECGWQAYEIEKITEDTPIETMVTL